jgi:PPOX class probable F420-dependent enzyme
MSILTPEDVALLEEKHLAVVASVMPDGSPQLTPVWIETDGETVSFNTAEGRVKHRNLVRDPHVAVAVVDGSNAYRWVSIRGRAEMTNEGADEQIDRLAKKYLDADSYPFRNPEETRVTVRIVPQSRTGMG